MTYIEKYCIDKDEKIITIVKKSKIALIWSWIIGILFCWLLLIPTFIAIKITIIFATTEFAITNKNIIEKYGFLSTHCDEMRIEKIENVTIQKTFFGRIFHYGDVCIQGANVNNINFSQVIEPKNVKRTLNELMA